MWQMEDRFISSPSLLWGADLDYEAESLNNLNLSWPESVNYHVDTTRPNDSSRQSDGGAEPSDACGRNQVTTYNGVPRKLIRNAQPLLENEIRVLDLSKASRGAPLVGSLRRVRLSDPGGYEPLSYTWEDHDTGEYSDDGPEDDVHPALFLLDTDQYLNLTSNCAKALYSVRKSTTDRTIWVDSICVNQDDAEERSRQVDLMKEIYAKAFTVLVYLGRESKEDDSSMAMNLLRRPDQLQKVDQLYQLTSLKRLFERHYFRRMWIVQEVALAQTLELHCGPDISYVSRFAGKPLEAILGSQVTPPWLRHSKQTANELSRHHATSQAGQLLSLIFDTALCECSDDRDRIFALFSLLNGSDKERLRANYGSSTRQVYTGIAAYLATNGSLWGVLIFAPRLALSSCLGLPSWVPDWKSLGKAGPQTPEFLELIASRSQALGPDTVLGVTSSGTITVRGLFLGSVSNSEDSCDYPFYEHGMNEEQRLTRDSFKKLWQGNGFNQSYKYTSVWTLKKTESMSSWECHLNFWTSCEEPRNAHHLAFMLPDYSTVLILRPHAVLRNQYTLVEIGTPLVGAVWPQNWKVDLQTRPHVPLHLLKEMKYWKQSHLDAIRSSQDALPRLSKYPELWSFNPSSSGITLTHLAIGQILTINMDELNLLQRWQELGRTGIQILGDKARVRRLIHGVKGLQRKNYKQRQIAAGLDEKWSLDHFLCLFMEDHFQAIPMEMPHVHLHGDLPLDEMDVLSQLMQWAQVTHQVLLMLENERVSAHHWPGLYMGTRFFSWAMEGANFQVSFSGVMDTSDAKSFPDRTLALLEKLWRRLSGAAGPEIDRDPKSLLERHFDWKRFNRVIDQRLSVLNDVKPDVEKLQAELRDFEPDFRVLTAHQVFAAHGVDLSKNELTQIQIR